MKHIEDDNQKALFDWAAHIPELRWMHAIPNGGRRNAAEGARLKRQGVKSGVWDIHLPVVTYDYPGLYIELKAGKNKLTENQSEFGLHLKQQGYAHHVCYTWTDAKDKILRYLGK